MSDVPANDLTAPIRYDVDLCVVGASSAAVAAAVAAAKAGRRVVVLTDRPYLGDDLTGSLRLRCAPGDVPRNDLARTIFGADGTTRPTPNQAKAQFDEALLSAGVEFCYGCFPYAILRAEDQQEGNQKENRIAGMVMASRGGLFAVRATEVIDATWRGLVARLAGVAFSAYPNGEQIFERVIVGGRLRSGAGVQGTTDAELVNVTTKNGAQSFPIQRYSLRIPMADGTPSSFAAAEVRAGDMTFDPGQARHSDILWQLPPDAIAASQPLVAWSDDADVNYFATSQAGLWLLSPVANMSRVAAADFVRPATFLAYGERFGAALAARPCVAISGAVTAFQATATSLLAGAVRTEQDALRNTRSDFVTVSATSVPQFATVDVIVMGGGTAGASAGIAAARAQAKTLVCEYQPVLGGVGTVGMIATYYFGNRVGFTAEIDNGTRAMGPINHAPKNPHTWNIEWKQRYYQMASDHAGAEIWYGSIGCGVIKVGNAVRGVVIATPWGVGAVHCHAVVDSSGNADVAAHAGAATEVIGGEHVATQGTGLGPRTPGYQYRNTDWTFIDDTDVVDTTHAMVIARTKFAQEFDVSTIIDSRERRRIIGDLRMSPVDFLAQRTFPDTVVTAHSNFDTHGFTIHPLFLVRPPDKAPLDAHVPYRCLLPKDLDGVVVTGLGKCAHRDAQPVIRMQPDVQNEGYAMGVAMAMAAAAKCAVRDIDLKALQAHLVSVGILAEDVPGHVDSFPLSTERIAEAVADPEAYIHLAIIFSQGERVVPVLRQAHAAATGDLRLRYAVILGLLDDASGADDLAASIAGQGWDEGWNYRGMGQFGKSASWLDAQIIALGRTKAIRHVAVVVDKISTLTADHHQSHSRAVAEACEHMPLPQAAAALAAFLNAPGVRGHHEVDLSAARANVTADPIETKVRNNCLREIHLARALYRVGDHQGIGADILAGYANDLRGLYARHARAVLAEGTRVAKAQAAG